MESMNVYGGRGPEQFRDRFCAVANFKYKVMDDLKQLSDFCERDKRAKSGSSTIALVTWNINHIQQHGMAHGCIAVFTTGIFKLRCEKKKKYYNHNHNEITADGKYKSASELRWDDQTCTSGVYTSVNHIYRSITKAATFD